VLLSSSTIGYSLSCGSNRHRHYQAHYSPAGYAAGSQSFTAPCIDIQVTTAWWTPRLLLLMRLGFSSWRL
jgi:hypothetical protein